MTTGSGAGNGAERSARAEARLRISPVLAADVERLAAMFARLPAVTGVRAIGTDGETASYAIETASMSSLLNELGQVASSIGAVVTRTIGGEIRFALPTAQTSALTSDAVLPDASIVASADEIPSTSSPRTAACFPTDGGEDAPSKAARSRDRRSRPRLRALPNPDQSRISPSTRARDWLTAWRQRRARNRARGGRSWTALVGVVVFAAIIAVTLTISDQCRGGSAARQDSRDAAGVGIVAPLV